MLMSFTERNVQEVRERLRQIAAEQENKKAFMEAHKEYLKAKHERQKYGN